MKRFIAVAAALMLTAVVSQTAEAAYCCWEGNSYNDNKGYCGPVTAGGSDTKEGTEAYCKANYGEVVSSCGGCNVGTGDKDEGEKCSGYCKWPTGCEAISTDPDGKYGDKTTTCAEAVANCQNNGKPSQLEDCSDVANIKVEYCYWGVGKCYPMNNPDGASADNPGMTNKEACEAYGHVSQLDDCSDVSSIVVEYCDWGADGCFPMNKPNDPSPENPGMTNKEACEAYGKVVSSCDNVAVRFLGNKAAKTNGLRVSYAKNRVSVNWAPSAKIGSGTVQLLNVKGVAVSTAFIKANSSKVSVKLGTVGVPAGMYFVHINAVGQNGKKIVAQSAIGVVK